MSSPNSSGNSYTTPQSSPEITETDLRVLENSLDNFREYLQGTVASFEEYSQHFTDLGDNVAHQLVYVQPTEASSDQVSTPRTHSYNLRRRSYPLFTNRLPIYPRTRPLSSSISSSTLRQSSSQGSVSVFGSPNTSLGNIEFEFHGLESPSDSSNFLHIGQQNHQDITMATPDGTLPPREPIEEENEPSDTWKRFVTYANSTLRAISKELTALSSTLQQPNLNQSVHQISAHTYRTTRFRTKLSMLEDRIEEVTCVETVSHTELDKLHDDINALSLDIDVQHALIDELVAQAKAKETKTDAVANALRKVANTPTVELPTFDGKTIDYQSFKSHFKYVIDLVNGPEELNATHLMNSLQGEVKQYIGAGNRWFNKYDALWQLLDSKYDNKYTLNYETLSAFFNNTLQSEEPDPVKNFVYMQLDNISNIESLGMSSEEVCTTMLVESLPLNYKTMLKDALRRKYPDNQKATYKIEEVRKVFNDTIGAIQDEAALQGKYPPTFLSHYGLNQNQNQGNQGRNRKYRGKKRGSGQPPNTTQPQSQQATP